MARSTFGGEALAAGSKWMWGHGSHFSSKMAAKVLKRGVLSWTPWETPICTATTPRSEAPGQGATRGG